MQTHYPHRIQSRLLSDARLFAIAAFEGVGKRRNYTGAPYVDHCEEVALLLEDAGWDEITIASGWLHDVAEDTAITTDLLRQIFSDAVSDTVAGVNDVSTDASLGRSLRALINGRHVVESSQRSHAVKLADICSNGATIVERSPSFAQTWLPEKAWVVGQISSSCPVLGGMAEDCIATGVRQLKAQGIEVEISRLDQLAAVK